MSAIVDVLRDANLTAPSVASKPLVTSNAVVPATTATPHAEPKWWAAVIFIGVGVFAVLLISLLLSSK